MEEVESGDALDFVDGHGVVVHVAGGCHVGVDESDACRLCRVWLYDDFEECGGHTNACVSYAGAVGGFVDRSGDYHEASVALRPFALLVFERLPGAGVEFMGLRADVGQREAVDHHLLGGLVVAGGADVAAVEAGAGVVVGGGAAVDVVVGPELVVSGHLAFGLLGGEFPGHPVGGVVVAVEADAETVVILELGGEAVGCHDVEQVAEATMVGGLGPGGFGPGDCRREIAAAQADEDPAQGHKD